MTLVECSDYVWSGVRYGLAEWRGSDWRWDYFGQMVPVKNSDLWHAWTGHFNSTMSSAAAAGSTGPKMGQTLGGTGRVFKMHRIETIQAGGFAKSSWAG